MTVWTLTAMALVATVAVMVLRQTQPSYATALTVIVGVLLFATAIQTAMPMLDTVRTLLNRSDMGSMFAPSLIKALGIGLLTQTAADVCRDAGETALANKVEFGGKVLLMLCALPLLEYTVSLLDGMIYGQAVVP